MKPVKITSSNDKTTYNDESAAHDCKSTAYIVPKTKARNTLIEEPREALGWLDLSSSYACPQKTVTFSIDKVRCVFGTPEQYHRCYGYTVNRAFTLRKIYKKVKC